MKKQLIRILIFSVIATTLISNQSALATPKKVGRSSDKSVANTILSGKGVPSPSLGINGDFYIDTKNLVFYGLSGRSAFHKFPSELKF